MTTFFFREKLAPRHCFFVQVFTPILFGLVVSSIAPVAAMELSIAFENAGVCVIPDGIEDVLRRSDDGTFRKIHMSADPNHAPSRPYFVPEDGASPQSIVIRLRLEDIPLEEQRGGAPTSESFFASGVNLANTNPAIGEYKWGTGEGDFVEFSFTLQNMYLSWGTSHYYKLQPSFGVFATGWYANFSIALAAPYEIETTDRDGATVDQWFVLVNKAFPDSYVDGGSLPEYMSLNDVPLAGETVSISGENLIFEPEEATTDSEGVFGVLAFVDPEAFNGNSGEGKGAIRDPAEKESASKTGTLSLEYKNKIRKVGIKGYYCEVVRVEGVVTIVYGSGGNLKVGDVLLPGTKLSLSTSYGKTALLGLRFMNGSAAELVQDVYTTGCITDLIEIGKTGITNLSVIRGKTPLATVSRYLCEQIAGLPNTPTEWAKSAGKLTVKTAASLTVPGAGVTAFAVRYVVKTAAGKVYDHVVTSPGDYHQKGILPLAVPPLGDERAEISWYYDGSTRVTSNLAGGVSLFDATQPSPLAVIPPDQWFEIEDIDTFGRTWSQSPDTLDEEGPEFRIGVELYPDAWITQLDLWAYDTSGLDESTFSVLSASQPVSGFERMGPGWWSASFLGPPITMPDLEFRLSDRLGNERVLPWSLSDIPNAPTLTQVRPGTYPGGMTLLGWTSDLPDDDLLQFELRQVWETTQGMYYGPWQSVGSVSEVLLELPEGVDLTVPYFIEVRAYADTGIGGFSAETGEMYPKAPSVFSGLILR